MAVSLLQERVKYVNTRENGENRERDGKGGERERERERERW